MVVGDRSINNSHKLKRLLMEHAFKAYDTVYLQG